MQTVAISHRVYKTAHQELRRSVNTPYTCHCLSALRWRQRVHDFAANSSPAGKDGVIRFGGQPLIPVAHRHKVDNAPQSASEAIGARMHLVMFRLTFGFVRLCDERMLAKVHRDHITRARLKNLCTSHRDTCSVLDIIYLL